MIIAQMPPVCERFLGNIKNLSKEIPEEGRRVSFASVVFLKYVKRMTGHAQYVGAFADI